MGEEQNVVIMKNVMEHECGDGEAFSYAVFLDGGWYHVPTKEGFMVFNSIGILVNGKSSQEKVFNISAYAPLPKGRYRIEASGLSDEFDVE